MNRQACCAALVAMTLAHAAKAQNEPGLDLAPLVPPDVPWLKKNQKKKPAEQPAPPVEAKKGKRKKPRPTPPAPKSGAAFVAAPPSAVPPLPLPELVAPPAPPPAPPAAPAVATPAPATPPPPADLSLPLPPPPAPVAATPPAPVQTHPIAPPAAPSPAAAPPPAVVSSTAPPPVVLPSAALAVAPAAPSSPRTWTRPAGYAALGLGAVAMGVGAYLGARSRSDINGAQAAFRSHGGAFTPAEADALASGNSKAQSANALFIASGVLLAAGALFTLAF